MLLYWMILASHGFNAHYVLDLRYTFIVFEIHP